MSDAREIQERRWPGGRHTRFHFINAESGRVMRARASDAADGSPAEVGAANGEARSWWAIEPVEFGAPVSDRWLLSNAASNHGTVLSVGPRDKQGARSVQMETLGDIPAANQLWYFEHYYPMPIMPRWAPMLPSTVRLWCMLDGERLVLTLDPRWAGEPPVLRARSSPDEGGASHWLPIMLSGETHD